MYWLGKDDKKNDKKIKKIFNEIIPNSSNSSNSPIIILHGESRKGEMGGYSHEIGIIIKISKIFNKVLVEYNRKRKWCKLLGTYYVCPHCKRQPLKSRDKYCNHCDTIIEDKIEFPFAQWKGY